ncbi:MAG: aspartate--tRNA(Asn) ligase [Nitrososphaerota archaeon]
MRSGILIDGDTIEIGGWVANIRDLGSLRFILIRDNEGLLQITLDRKLVEQKLFKLTDQLTNESVIKVKGIVKADSRAPGGFEIIPSSIEIISKADTPLPLDTSGKIESSMDVSLNWRCLSLRIPKNQAIFKIQASLVRGMQDYLNRNGFLNVFTPCLMGVASETGAEVFQVLYFDREAYLRQDPQLHRQLAILSGFEKIYELGPSFRADPSDTPRHLCEYRSCAVEMAWINDERDTMRVETELIVSAIKRVIEECQKELDMLGVHIEVPKTPFPEIKFPEVYEILSEYGKIIPWGEDYDRESEKILWQYVKEKYDNDFFFVNRFPFRVKPFYVMRVEEDPQWARSVDLIYKGLELSSGGQREHRYENLLRNIREKGMDENNLKWFTKFFRFGAPPHGGFAIGIERLTMQLLGLKNIREATLFPRDMKRLLP